MRIKSNTSGHIFQNRDPCFFPRAHKWKNNDFRVWTVNAVMLRLSKHRHSIKHILLMLASNMARICRATDTPKTKITILNLFVSNRGHNSVKVLFCF